MGCGATGVESTAAAGTTSASTTTSTTTTTATTADGAALTVETARAANATPDAADVAWDEASATTITLSGSTATVDGEGVTVDGNTVTITAGGTYLLTGSLDGQVVVNSASDDEVKLVLSGAEITSDTGPAITVADAGEAVVVLADGTSNALTDASSYADTSEEAPNAALYSKADLTIGGEGSLTVTGRSLDGIASADGLVIVGGDIQVTAADDGIRGKDHLAITGGALTVEAGGDALKSTNDTEAESGFIDISGGTLALTSGTDGFDAATDVIISGGTLTVDAGDDGIHAELSLVIGDGEVTLTRSYEGLEAQYIAITGGTIDVTAEDDGLNVSAADTSTSADTEGQMGGGPGGGMATIDGLALVSGGTLTIDAGGDGFDSNGNAEITGGTVVVHGPAQRRQRRAGRQRHLHDQRRHAARRRLLGDGRDAGRVLDAGLGAGDGVRNRRLHHPDRQRFHGARGVHGGEGLLERGLLRRGDQQRPGVHDHGRRSVRGRHRQPAPAERWAGWAAVGVARTADQSFGRCVGLPGSGW